MPRATVCGRGALLIIALACASVQRMHAQTPAQPPAQPQTTRCSFASERFRADSVPGVGSVVYAGGGVRIVCPSRGITITGDSAQRFADHDQMIGHAVYDEPRLHVTSDYLSYFQRDERVLATANVHARLPSGSTLDGPQAEFRRAVPRVRPRQQISAIARPTITIVEKDSAGKPQPPTKVIANTVFMDGDSLIYGGGQVVITRTDVNATADSAFIDQGREVMHLMRNPILRGKKEKPFTLSGDRIHAFWHDRKLNRVLSMANAKAVSDSMTLTADTIDLRVKDDLLDRAFAWARTKQAHVVSTSQTMTADSLDVLMPKQKMRLVNAVRRAYAEGKPDTVRFRAQAPDTTDWIRGDTIVAHFDTIPQKDTTKTPPIKRLVATGAASSLYHMAPNDTAERRAALNHVTARVITIAFNDQKVATVTTVDSVSGVYLEPRPDTLARRQAAAQAKADSARQPAVPSIVPVPAKTPPRTPPTTTPQSSPKAPPASSPKPPASKPSNPPTRP